MCQKVEPVTAAGRHILMRSARIWIAIAAVLAMAAAGCSTGAGGHAVAASVPNKVAAQHEADRLLSLVRLPAGAHGRRTAPAHLDGPALGTPSVSSLIDRHSFWTVPMSAAGLVSWLGSHPPGGNLTSSGTAQSGGPDFQTSGIGSDDARSAAWESASLELGVIDTTRGHSALRVDAVVVWLDPRPLRDAAGGTRIHFTVADGCPRSDRGSPGVANFGPGLDTALLPTAQPTRALLCRYEGLNGNAFTLTGHRLLTGPAATALADRIRRLPLSHPDGGVVNCPNDDGAAGYLAFDYPHHTTVDLEVALGGCSTVANGHIAASPGDLPAMFQGADWAR